MPPRARAQPLEENILLTATLCLLAAGAVMVYSASSTKTLLQGQGDGTTYLVRYIGYGIVGCIVMNVIARRPLQQLLSYTEPFLVVCFGLVVAVRLPGVGVSVNGAQRWLGAGPLQFQPSELMKLAIILYGVKLIAQKPQVIEEPRLLGPLAVRAGAACMLIAMQPDLGTALVIVFALSALLIAAGLPLRTFAIGCGVLGVFILLFALVEPYRRARLTSFIDPWQHAGTSGFQSVQGQIALGSGGLTGRGVGESVQKAFFLPEAHTDFILAIIGEELGVAGVSVLLVLYGLIAYAGLRIAQGASGTYAKLLCVGITSMILCQALLNVFTVLGLAPLTGVPLPLISYGSTNLIVVLAGVGVLLNVARGGSAHLRVVEPSSTRNGSKNDRDRGGRNGGARGARAGGRRRLAG